MTAGASNEDLVMLSQSVALAFCVLPD